MGVASGLEYLHTLEPAPVVHGSLRGSHILLDDDLNARLSDFGISHLLTNARPCIAERSLRCAWSSPEECVGVEATTASDIYSFASVAYELITDTPPLEYMHRLGVHWIRTRIIKGEIPSFPTEQFRELPSENCRMWRLMLRC
ncbi:kinase-like domain-containing protein [Lyophyllum atratum]|nr:kinase-like domain-containing protein [Lyophyllum atratum]